MRSATDDRRLQLERALRAIGLAALIGLAARLTLSTPTVAPTSRLTTTDLAASLTRATRTVTPAIHLEASRALAPDERDWLRALDRAGTQVTWHAPQFLPPLALQAEPVVAPGGRYLTTLMASPDAPVALRDGVGLVDSLGTGKRGLLSVVTPLEGSLRFTTVTGTASIPSLDTAIVRTVLVVGAAGWESKYVLAALEESGWQVETRLLVAPNVYIGSGRTSSLDTSRLSAVVLLDSLALSPGEVARFLRSGGGVVLASGAAANAGLASLAGVIPVERLRGELGALASSDPQRGLSAVGFRLRDARSTVLERRGPSAVAVARRVVAGRILVLGADETWRWRMQGPDGSVEAHRAWWSSAVARVAYAPAPNGARWQGLDAAPLAAMYAVLGSPTPARTLTTRAAAYIVDALLLTLALLSLLGEWASRRLRGAR